LTGERVDPKYTNAAVELLKFQLRDKQLILRYRAITALGAIGPEARTAIPELLEQLGDRETWELRQAAATALGVVANQGTAGPRQEVMPPLYSRLQDPAMQVRIAAVQALTFLGPSLGEKDAYVKALLPVALKDPEPGLQIWARVAIIGAEEDFSNGNISPIVKHMASDDPGVRVQAIQAIGTMGQKAKLGIPGLIRALSDTEPLVLASALWALSRMESYAAEAIPVLQKISTDPNQSDYMKKMAKDTIAKITGEKAAEK
jgi:HEAT repeat protein